MRVRDEGSNPHRTWTKESLADWFETEGSAFLTNKRSLVRARVIVASQIENGVIQSVSVYLKGRGFTPTFRPTGRVRKNGKQRIRSAEFELLSNLEQECFLRQIEPLLRTERVRNQVRAIRHWLQERRQQIEKQKFKGRFRHFECPEL
jgi:hypothetical protein